MDKTKLPTTAWTDDKGVTVSFTWYPGNDLEKFQPFVQVYGVCFNAEGKMLIQRRDGSDWCLAGGTVEAGETPEETLRREIIEEADVTIKNPILLGGQRVQFPGGKNPNPGKRGGDDFYQLRYYCEVDEVLPQTPDPDTDIINDRLFVDPAKITDYFDWGTTGAAIFSQATTLYNKLHN